MKKEVESQPLLSIVVPTRNRGAYLKACVASLLRLDTIDVEIVVADSSHSDELSEIFKRRARSDCRFVYSYTGAGISMTENFNRGMAAASGRYVCFIGDDDCVLPEIVKVVRWAHLWNIDAVAPITSAQYFWPDFSSADRGGTDAGKLYVNGFSGAVSRLDLDAGLSRCADAGGQYRAGLPRAYFGVVKRECFESVRRETGSYFDSVSPDLYSAITLSKFARLAYTVDYPFVLPGSSGQSNSGRSALGTHVGNLKQDPHLAPYKDLEWPPEVPSFFSVETVWGQAAFTGFKHLARPELTARFNTARLYALCLIRHRFYRRQVFAEFWGLAGENGIGSMRLYAKLVRELLSVWATEILRRAYRALLPERGLRERAFSSLTTIAEAVETLDRHLNDRLVLPSLDTDQATPVRVEEGMRTLPATESRRHQGGRGDE